MFRRTCKFILGTLIAVICRFLLHGVFRGVLCLYVLALCPMIPAPAEEIAYPGVLLQDILGVWGGNANLAPTGSNTGKSNSLSDNKVTVLSGGIVPGNVFGAYNNNDTNVIANNAVFIYGNVNGFVFGGWSSSGNVTGNSVTISGGMVRRNVFGGGSNSGNVTGNSVTVSGGGEAVDVYGGISNSGNVTGNSVTISDGDVSSVYGGCGGNAAVGNSVTVSGGGVVWGEINGGLAFDGNATGNSVAISDTTVGSDVVGGWSWDGHATNNTVTISDTTVKQDVYGGYSRDDHATNNTVTISNTTVEGDVYGGCAFFGGGNATSNSITMSGGTVEGNVYGGHSWVGDATNNSVTINGGKVEGDIYGGYNDATTSTGKATGNTVTISGTPDLTDSKIYGGFSNGTGDVFTGNTFHLYNTSLNNATQTITAKGLANFQNLNFYVPASAVNRDVMLEITDTANIDNSRLKVVFDVANSSLQTHDKIILIDAGGSDAQLVGLPENTILCPTRSIPLYRTRVRKGTLMGYDVEILIEHESGDSVDAGQLVLYILGAETIPEAGAITNGYLTGAMMLNQGGNLIAGQTLAGKMMCAAKHPGFLDLGVFCDISGSWSRYHTNAQTDLSGTNLLLGVSRCFRLKPLFRGGQVTQLMIGGFFEHGNGSYDSLRSLNNGATVRTGGKLDSYGGGVLGRWDFGKFRIRQDYAHSYIDGSFRAGNLRNRYTSDLCDSFDMPAGFFSNSAYHGTHVGVGRVRHFASGATFDLSGKYFWTQMQGKSLELTTRDPVDFESVNSHRLRVGGRYNFATNSRLTPYLGGYWEREFSGTARSSTSGFALPASSLRGNTGIGEAGIALKPATSRGFCIDLGVQCYGGKRDGVNAALNIGRNF